MFVLFIIAFYPMIRVNCSPLSTDFFNMKWVTFPKSSYCCSFNRTQIWKRFWAFFSFPCLHAIANPVQARGGFQEKSGFYPPSVRLLLWKLLGFFDNLPFAGCWCSPAAFTPASLSCRRSCCGTPLQYNFVLCPVTPKFLIRPWMSHKIRLHPIIQSLLKDIATR